jgi:hypothetical protein
MLDLNDPLYLDVRSCVSANLVLVLAEPLVITMTLPPGNRYILITKSEIKLRISDIRDRKLQIIDMIF